MAKKNLSVRFLSGVVCSMLAGAVFCMGEPMFAQAESAWSNSGNSGNSGGSYWNDSTSNSGSSGGNSWGSSASNSGSSWGASSFGGSKQETQAFIPNPLTPISHADYQRMVKQYNGKIVIVNFFASWCGPCRQEIADLKALRERMSPDDLVIISISVDDRKSDLESVLRETNFNYPTAWASDELQQAFNIKSIPRMIIYDRQGGTWVDQVGLVPRDEFFDVIQRMVDF